MSKRIGSFRSIDSESEASTENVKKYDEPGSGKNPSRKKRWSDNVRLGEGLTSAWRRPDRDERPPEYLSAAVRGDAGIFPPVLTDLSVRSDDRTLPPVLYDLSVRGEAGIFPLVLSDLPVRGEAGIFPPVLIDVSVRQRENPMMESLRASMSPETLQ